MATLPSQSAVSVDNTMRMGKPLGGVVGTATREAPVFTTFDKFFKGTQQQMEKIEIANCAPGKIFSLSAAAPINAERKMPSLIGGGRGR